MAISCELCRRPLQSGEALVVPDGDNWHLICQQCNAALNTCAGCTYGNQCLFETSPNPLPKVITKQVRTPMGIMQTQVKNPEREAKLCSTCRCWILNESNLDSSDSQSQCGKNFNYCSRLSPIYQTPIWLKEEENQ